MVIQYKAALFQHRLPFREQFSAALLMLSTAHVKRAKMYLNLFMDLQIQKILQFPFTFLLFHPCVLLRISRAS